MRKPVATLALVLAFGLLPSGAASGKQKDKAPLPITDATVGGPGIAAIPANGKAVVWLAEFSSEVCVTVTNPTEVPIQLVLDDGLGAFRPVHVVFSDETIVRCSDAAEVWLSCADPLPCKALWRVDEP